MIYTSDIKGYLDLFGTHKFPKFAILRGATFTEPSGREYGANGVLEVGTGRVDLAQVSKHVVELSQGP